MHDSRHEVANLKCWFEILDIALCYEIKFQQELAVARLAQVIDFC